MKIKGRCYRLVKCPARKKKRKKRVSKKKARSRARAALMGEGVAPVKERGGIKAWAGKSDKAYISDLYERAPHVGRASFNGTLLAIHRHAPGGILSRLDLTAAGDPKKIAASRIQDGNAEYHLIDLKVARRLAKEWS